MKSIKAQTFYDILEFVEDLKQDYTCGYYPTVEEFEAQHLTDDMEKVLPLLAYFASDPFKKMGLSEQDDEEYKRFVDYSKKLISKIELTE